jgi:hypothetical protein
MSNIIFRNKIYYYYECYWRTSKNDKTTDSNGNKFPWPKHNAISWSDKENFIDRLKQVENFLDSHEKIKNVYKNKDCLLCDKKNITNGSYNLNNTIWENGLMHYINVHNTQPSDHFKNVIYSFNPQKKSSEYTFKYNSKIYIRGDMKYVKIERNQLMILDALLKHGGYTKKYVDTKNKHVFRFSEHMGLLDFNRYGLDKIIISGKTNRVDREDDDIYFPINIPDAIDYEYMFHTHPPTPKPGGRVDVGVLYEFPSPSDIFHFIDHFNEGITQGSLVIAAEGLYNIRKLIFDRKKIKVNENKLFADYRDTMYRLQNEAIKKYGSQFTTYQFNSKISQDLYFIKELSSVLNKYNLQIDYYPREKDPSGKWIIETVYLPIFVIEPK